jgi:hypothetical protein
MVKPCDFEVLIEITLNAGSIEMKPEWIINSNDLIK